MSLSQRLGAGVVAAFAIAFARMPWLIRLLNPVMTWLLATPIPMGPNALLTVRGRRTGLARKAPVAFVDVDGRGLLQAASAQVEWVRNLRTSREAVITWRGRDKRYEAIELAAETAGPLMRDALARFPRSRSIRAVVGPVDRPPVAVLQYFRVRVDDALEDYIRTARRQPVFELHQALAHDQ